MVKQSIKLRRLDVATPEIEGWELVDSGHLSISSGSIKTVAVGQKNVKIIPKTKVSVTNEGQFSESITYWNDLQRSRDIGHSPAWNSDKERWEIKVKNELPSTVEVDWWFINTEGSFE